MRTLNERHASAIIFMHYSLARAYVQRYNPKRDTNAAFYRRFIRNALRADVRGAQLRALIREPIERASRACCYSRAARELMRVREPVAHQDFETKKTRRDRDTEVPSRPCALKTAIRKRWLTAVSACPRLSFSAKDTRLENFIVP